ncbi:MAG: hypothetical protein AAGB35_05645 [Pseudomonadota bacterium]
MFNQKKILLTSILISYLLFPVVNATATVFEAPDANSNGWGGWTRGDLGTLYAQWEIFSGSQFFPPVDETPDVGIDNVTLARVRDISLGETAQFTGSGNIYNLVEINRIAITITGDSNGPTSGPVQVVAQMATLGTVYDFLRLEGNEADQITVLRSDEGTFTPPGGVGEQPSTNEEILFVWNLPNAQSNYNFEMLASDTSLSFDAFSVDIGPISTAPGPNSVSVPIPIPFLVLAGLLLTIIGWTNSRN